MKQSTFKLKQSRRKGGGGQMQRDYLDFVVDGKVIYELVAPGDCIGCLGWGLQEIEKHTIAQLLLEESPEPESGRVPIYICPECGALGCGAVTVKIEKSSEWIVWSDFAFENNYEGTVELYSEVGPFYFKKDPYTQVLRGREVAV